ncbi:Putative polypeptide N-acetylgalactosaminyltransferase 8 [Pteropus alecto]|uniref:Putative polypeptide N-acetylgalactosaminyltransferase 8 n=1 Tax=Pteropus alecto TaxID=9402 RepID=L5JU66_PTEAL|nr:Putative polypeptide N-acetylgalactosaminyltransferase 8 [Pteropus alecto]
MKLAMRQQENVDNTPGRVEAKASETDNHKCREKLSPNSPLFKHWGEDLSETQQKKAQDLFWKFSYNVYLSNQLPLNRPIPDTQDSSVILIFMNEALSIIQGAITSIINRTPSRFLKEVTLVDDFSSNVQHTKRKGLAQARNTGREVATADMVAILDTHVEVNAGWAEPILAQIQEDHTVIVPLVFDNIHFDTFELGMAAWRENRGLALLPDCSPNHKPYALDLPHALKRNALSVAEI